jgi:Zn-dependent protease with chaperone function
MDFFASQEMARRNTRRLVFFFGLAVILIVVAVNLAAASIFRGVSLKLDPGATPESFDPQLALAVTIATLAVILIGSLYKTASLREGGAAVARLLGGRPVDPNTNDPIERRLLNVVEEMAIATGAPVPEVFVLDGEAAINAFAAGHSSLDSVIAVSAGCLEQLKRDELQGVVAHEFSHIVNGDMRLNLRLMGILHGILVIALIGYWVLRSTRFFGSSGRAGKREGGGLAIAILLFAAALLAIGWIGVFFGRLIKSGVSRQREYLADAAAVQFTRNPFGLAGALKRIGDFVHGSRLDSKNAEQASHLFFSNGLRRGMSGFLATHPPLAKRIRCLDPQWDGEFLHRDLAPESGVETAAAGVAPLAAASERTVEGELPVQRLGPSEIVARVGDPSPHHLAYGAQLLAALPPELKRRIQEPLTARAVVLGLLLDRSPEFRQRQLRVLEESIDGLTYSEIMAVLPLLEASPMAARLPLVDLSVPALRTLSPRQYTAFRTVVENLIMADDRVNLFEFALQHILMRHLEPRFGQPPKGLIRHRRLARVTAECSLLLSALAYAGNSDDSAAQVALQEASQRLGQALTPRSRQDASLAAVSRALRELASCAPRLKARILEAAIATAIADREVTVAEGELLRAIADALDCPIPPFLPGQVIAG